MRIINRCVYCGKEDIINEDTSSDPYTLINLYICPDCMKKLIEWKIRVISR